MFVVNDDNSIYATRGDIVFFAVTAEDKGKNFKFQPGDVLRMKVYGKKDAENVVLQKDFPVSEITESVEIRLTEQDTKFGEVISKPKDYWYEIELNPGTAQTIVGYDEDGAKLFKLFPEGDDIPPVMPKPEDIPVVDDELDLASPRPVQNQAIARELIHLRDECERTRDAVTALHVTPEMYGAIGDGVADDTEALQEAFAHTGKVVLNGTYRVTERVMCSSSYLVGNNSVIKSDFGSDVTEEDVLRFVGADNVTIEGLVIDGNGKNMRFGICLMNCGNVNLRDIKIKNVCDMDNTTSSFFIYAVDCENVNATRISVSDCKKRGDGVIAGSGVGAVYGFFAQGYRYLRIGESAFSEIRNIDSAGSIIAEDAAAIYIHNNSESATSIIENVSGFNTGKRFIKAQCVGLVNICGVIYHGTGADLLVAINTQFSGDSAQAESGMAIIANAYLVNDNGVTGATSFLIATSENAKISNSVLMAKSGFVFQQTKDSHHGMNHMIVSDCDIYGNLMSCYGDCGSMTFKNNEIECGSLVYAPSVTSGGNIVFSNNRMKLVDDYGTTYVTSIANFENVTFDKCVVDDHSTTRIETTLSGKLILLDSIFKRSNKIQLFFATNDVDVLGNIFEYTGTETNTRFIQVFGGKNVNIANTEGINHTYYLHGNANFYIGANVNICHIVTNEGAIVSCVPSYRGSEMDSFNTYTIGDGALYVSTVDGKLRKLDKSQNAWVVVG